MLTNDKNLPRGQISVTELKNNERQSGFDRRRHWQFVWCLYRFERQ